MPPMLTPRRAGRGRQEGRCPHALSRWKATAIAEAERGEPGGPDAPCAPVEVEAESGDAETERSDTARRA